MRDRIIETLAAIGTAASGIMLMAGWATRTQEIMLGLLVIVLAFGLFQAAAEARSS